MGSLHLHLTPPARGLTRGGYSIISTCVQQTLRGRLTTPETSTKLKFTTPPPWGVLMHVRHGIEPANRRCDASRGQILDHSQTSGLDSSIDPDMYVRRRLLLRRRSGTYWWRDRCLLNWEISCRWNRTAFQGTSDFVRLLTQHQRDMYLYIRSLLPDRHEADDVLQEVNLVLWDKRAQFRIDSNFRAWAFQIARIQDPATHCPAQKPRCGFLRRSWAS